MKRQLFLISILFTFVLCVNAQYVTSGKVIDEKGDPVSGAKVRAIGSTRTTETGVDGSFTLETTIPIKRVEASSLGKTSATQMVDEKYTIITLEKRNWWNTSQDRYQWFVCAEGAFLSTDSKDFPFGLMIGLVKQYGFYIRGMFSGLPSSEAKWDGNSTFYSTGKLKTGYMSVTAGGMIRLGCPIYLYAGAGWQKRVVTVEHLSGKYYENEEKTKSGIAIDAGAMLHVSSFIINVGTTLGCKASVHFGLGYKF